ncbi:adenylyl/guanylyl cyclase [Fragilaria crotonensis]|nr:adenylyl/guanylyl cyclase [Fragilaria crotonensis]
MTVLRIGAVQPPLRQEDQDPVEYTRNQVLPLLMSRTDVDIFVLPELCPIGYIQHTLDHYLDDRDVQRKIDKLMSDAARGLGAFIAYGRIGDSSSSSDHDCRRGDMPPLTRTIEHVILDESGLVVASYSKMLLCHYGDCAETRYFTAGTELCSFECRGFRLGILICADMRNPLMARRLVAESHHMVDVVLQPAAFSRDFSFRTWKSFRETRAVENSIYWVGVNYAGAYYGNSSFNPPWIDEDSEPIVLGMKEGVLVGTVERSILDHVRSTMPYYQILMVSS